ncbi:PAS domain-containing protein [Phenylobacterium sp.]|uniref:PAS domain-containing protein n=1 Tax=Phenylobacterium sp. TaxID=1871053 RepID=UPI002733852D|nr:PAS domain-containing protein [Phenylobacterium sp.]MDP3854000.1 PAS domain-containing protein [Phenylobacterium sp.]
MFHSNTQNLIDYWRGQGGYRGLPTRAQIDPTAFAKLLPQVFMLGRVASGLYPVRLAGGLVAALHGRNLLGQNGLSLFSERNRFSLHTAIETARRRPEPVVATVEAFSDTASLPMEVLFAPLADAEGSPERFLGLYQPLSMVARLNGEPIREIIVHNVRGVGPANEETPRLRLVALDGRRVA